MSGEAHAIAARRETVGVPNGRLGVWWFLASEVALFGGLIAVYVLHRLHNPGFAQAASHTLMPLGAINTFVLLTSSLTVVLAHAAAEAEDRPRVLRWEAITVLLGGVFLCVKGFEYAHEIGEGFTPKAGIFWQFYFLMTGLHALHVIVGILAHFYACSGVVWGGTFSRVTPAGLYWHFVDVVWIFLFPLIYIAS